MSIHDAGGGGGTSHRFREGSPRGSTSASLRTLNAISGQHVARRMQIVLVRASIVTRHRALARGRDAALLAGADAGIVDDRAGLDALRRCATDTVVDAVLFW